MRRGAAPGDGTSKSWLELGVEGGVASVMNLTKTPAAQITSLPTAPQGRLR